MIKTKFIGPTNSTGARLKFTMNGKVKYFNWMYNGNYVDTIETILKKVISDCYPGKQFVTFFDNGELVAIEQSKLKQL